jgi:hypothetical protein
MLFPSAVKEYSTVIAFDVVVSLATNPVDSRWRSVLVSMRCETLPRWQRKSPSRQRLCTSKNKIFGVHLPINSAGLFSSCVVAIKPCLVRERLHKMSLFLLSRGAPLTCASQTAIRAGHLTRLPVLPRPAQLGTHVYLVCRSESLLSTLDTVVEGLEIRGMWSAG